MSDKPDELAIDDTWICVGHTIGDKDQEVAEFRPIDLSRHHSDRRTPAIDTTGEPMRFAYAGITAGGVHDVRTNPGRTRAQKPSFRRLWADQETRAPWQLATRGVRAEIARRKAERAAKRDDALFAILEPLRVAYHRAPYYQRRAMEMVILDQIRRPLKG